MTSSRKKTLVTKLVEYIRNEREKNRSVVTDMLTTNMGRIKYMGIATFLVHSLFAVLFGFLYGPASEVEEAWRQGLFEIHAVSACIVLAVTAAAFRLHVVKASTGWMVAVEYLYMADLLAAGIAITAVDQLVTSNITPFLIVCTIIGFFIIKRPVSTLVIFTAAYGAFHWMTGLYQKDGSVHISNLANGFTFCAIGVCLSLIIWYSFRTNIMQDRIIREQQEELQQLAFFDNLTGLLNRRRWMAIARDEIERLNRYGTECGLILMDVDHFKAVNDEYGHPAGDKVLEEIAYILKKELRITDKVARWGGEEFIILLPETSVANAMASAEKIRRSIEEMRIQIDGGTIRATASFGVARIMRREDFAVSYNRADEALYLAKRLGRNMVRSMETYSLHEAMPDDKTTA